MKILFLTNNDITRPLYDWLVSQGEEITCSGENITAEDVIAQQIEFIISYNYRFLIEQSVISLLPHRIINLHISYLPWNRGASPNLWAFLEDTPCGVTIHEVDQGLDTGDILIQHKLTFACHGETLKSAYEKSHLAIQGLFRTYWDQIRHGKIRPKKQEGTGSCHSTKDMIPYLPLFSYDDYIDDFVQKVKSHESL